MTVAEAIQQIPFLRTLSTEDRELIAAYAQLRTLEPSDACWAQGQPTQEFVFVVEGRMKLVQIGESGRNTILEMAQKGELLCGSAVFCYAPYCCSSISMEAGTQVLVMPRRDLLELIERNAAAARAFMRELACRGVGMCQRVEELASGRVEQRIALFLLRLADSTGTVRKGEGIYVPIRLSRQDLADLAGTSLETAIRVMSRWKKQGIVRTIPRGFIIRDRSALEALRR